MLTVPYLNYSVPDRVESIYYTLNYRFKYIPYTIAEDVANVASYWVSVGRVGGFIGGTKGINGKYREFLYSIPFDLFRETSPYNLAVEVIKHFSSKYNFRHIEKALENNDDSFEFSETVNFNPLVDFDEVTENVKELLNIDLNSYIDLNVVNLFKVTETFLDTFKIDNNNETAKMRNYTQLSAISKYKLVLPTFKYNFPLKNFNLKVKSPNEIAIFRDVSRSSENLDSTFKALLLYFIQTYSNKTITVHEFINRIVKTHTLKSIDDIKGYYNTEIKYYYSVLNFSPKYINKYSECYIVTSGKTDKYPKMLNCVINGVSKGGNTDLELLCKNTNGKYIKL